MIRVLFLSLLAGNLVLAGWLMRAEAAGPAARAPAGAVPDAKRLVLLSERDALPAPAAPKAQTGALMCYTLGPFRTRADANRAASRIEGAAARLAIRSIETRADIGNWVYIPALADREAALQIARRLDAAGLKDYYIIGGGDAENTISLGLYREPGNARGRVQYLQNLGFDVEMKERTEIVPRYWIDYGVRSGDAVVAGNAVAGSPEITPKKTPCKRA